MSIEEDKKAAEEHAKKLLEANQKRNDERLERMNAIADSAERARPDEIEGLDESESREARAAADDAEAEKYARSLQQEGVTKEETQDEDTKVVNGETYYRMMVAGQERWQTLKDIRANAQKVESADEYLRQANESVKNAARLAPSSQDETSRLEKDELRKLLASVALGDEEAIEKLASVLSKPSEVTPDVLQKIDQRLSFRTELARLEDDSKDLLKDQYMGRLFRSRLNELKNEQPTMGLSEAYTSIDRELRGAFPGFKSRTQDKLERKRSLPTPTSASTRQTTEVEEEGEENMADVIEKMAKARGLAPHVHTRRQ